MTTRTMRNFTAVCAFGMSLCGTFARATDGTRDFARYQVILDRAPFGAMAGTAVEAQQPSFSTRFTFIGTAKEGDKPLIAIVMDKEGNRVHFVAAGDKIGPVTVVKIEKVDKAPAKLVLKQDLEVATLLMDSKAAGVGAPPAVEVPPPQLVQPGQPPIPGVAQPGVRRIPFVRGISK
ncbi:MAG: hypothetical protein ABSH14_06880 [Verrucomicrobiia bacterium]